MSKKLEGMVALVTGSGGGGIGTGIALCLAEYGAKVAVNDLTEELANATVEQIKAMGGEAFAVIGDVTNTDDVTSMVTKTADRFGKIDILVNSVGTGGRSAVENMPDEEWITTLKVDLTAPFKMCRAVVPYMRKQQFGRIIHIGSVGGLRVNFVTGAHVTAAKSGLLGLARHLAAEEGENKITVNCVLPGGTLTPKLYNAYPPEMHENLGKDGLLGRYATPKDIGEAVAFLASHEAEHITGSYIPVDGGSLIFTGSIDAYLKGRSEMVSKK